MSAQASLNYVTNQVTINGETKTINSLIEKFEEYIALSTFKISEDTFSVSIENYLLLNQTNLPSHTMDVTLDYVCRNRQAMLK